jgi:4-hydroxybenzoate polyprenyltransferase
MKWNAYYRLARFHKPAGTLLLWTPTAWALWIANNGHPPFAITVLLLFGTIFMRAAGCVMNDIADRQIDLHVWRTKNRPLTSGEVTLQGAMIFLFILLLAALLILLQLPPVCFYFALLAILVTVIYPFCKRSIQCPQLVLGIAFSLGIPMAFAASYALSNTLMYYLLVINVAWILAYDTEYAMVDRREDLRIGVKSTAILFAPYDKLTIVSLQIISHALWIPVALTSGFSIYFYACWFIALLIVVYQQWLLASGDEKNYLKAFSSNSGYGLILWVGLIAEGIFK